MALERWTANPPDDFLQTMDLWIRIRHIPVEFFTTDTMYRLASEVGKVETIAYDPKVSHTIYSSSGAFQPRQSSESLT